MITPDEFDTIVRDTLRDVDTRMRPDAGAADRLIANAREGGHTVVAFRRRANWTAPLLAAAAVVAVVVAAVLLSDRSDSGPTQPGTHAPSVPHPTSSKPTSAPTSSVPTDVTPTPSIAGFKPTDVFFRDRQHGWALGDGRCPSGTKSNCPTMFGTADGGSTWHRVKVPSGLVSTRDSASCGDNGTISGPCVDQVVFANQKIGYLWSYHAFFLTTDGGAHWTTVDRQQPIDLVVLGGKAVLLEEGNPCSAGCSYGVFAAPIGTTNWSTVIPYSHGNAGDWQLAGHSGTAYLLRQYPTAHNHPHAQALYRSTDGTHWTPVTGAWPCGKQPIDTIAVNLDRSLSVTCG